MNGLTIYLLNELRQNKLRIIQNYEIRQTISKKPKDKSFIDYFKSIIKQKNKMSEIHKISKKTELDKDDYELFKSIIGSIKIFDEFTIDYLTCYISYIEGSKDLNDNRENYMEGYEEVFLEKRSKKELINYEELNLNILSDTGLTEEILQDLIDNKIEIIKNYYYRQELSKISGKTHIDKFINYIKNKDSVTKINELTDPKKLPKFLFEKIISTIDDFDDWTLDYLTVYSSIINQFGEFDFKNFKVFINKLKWKEWRFDTMYNYDDTFYTVNVSEIWNTSIAKLKYNKLVELMKKDKDKSALFTCKGSKKYIFDMNFKDIKKKIKDRKGELKEIERKGNKVLWETEYNNGLYNIVSNFDKVHICKDLTPHKSEDYNFFIDFIEEAYSPIYNAMDQSNNLPTGSHIYKELRNRKSLIRFDSLKNVSESSRVGKLIGPDNRNVAYTVDKFKTKLNTVIEGKENSAVRQSLHRTGDILTDIMKCMRNDRFTEEDVKKAKKDFKNKKITEKELKKYVNKSGKPAIIWNPPTIANYHREPFMKYILHFPNNKCSGTDDSILLNIVKRELNNALVCIREKNYIDKNKEYFLIDSEGGGDMHFDYALYAFTESQLNQSENSMMTKGNLWKKLEFKSNEGAKSISSLPGFITKSIDNLFYTYKSTFANQFEKNRDNKKWLKTYINGSEYFTKAIENVLKGQKNKTFIIWNVEMQKIYLDEFYPDELIIKRINKVPQITFDEVEFVKNGKIKINVEMKQSILIFTLENGTTSFNVDFKPSENRKNIYSDCSIY